MIKKLPNLKLNLEKFLLIKAYANYKYIKSLHEIKCFFIIPLY